VQGPVALMQSTQLAEKVAPLFFKLLLVLATCLYRTGREWEGAAQEGGRTSSSNCKSQPLWASLFFF